MKIALAQMEVHPGRPRKNLEEMLEMIERAKEQKVDLIAFPEMCMGGYLVGDKWTEDNGFCANLMGFNEILKKASEGIAITYGNIYLDDKINERVGDDKWHPNKDGRARKYNAVYIFQNGKEVPRAKETKALPSGVQPKALLPTYRFFDDQRYFFGLEDVAKDFGLELEELEQPFLIEADGKTVPVGFETCEDLWCEDYRRDGKRINPTKMLIHNGAEKIINLSASPWTFGKNGARDRRVKSVREDCGEKFVPFYYVNNIGAQNNGKNIITFDGGSTVYNEEGEPVLFSHAPYQKELMVVDDSTIEEQPLVRKEKPKIAQKLEAILNGIGHLRDMTGNDALPKFVIGMSGGIDSAIVAAILTLAVGPERVLGVNMPTQYNSEKTKGAAAHIAEKLEIGYVSIPIEELVKVNTAILEKVDADGSGRKLRDIDHENIPAKIRGTSVLSNLAAKYGAYFTNNGNKLEIALGYATLYGDIGGAIAVIADLTKTEVFEMARYLNTEVFHDEVIPETLIPDKLFRFRKDQIQPSAELKKDQVDPMKFGYHDALLEKYLDFRKNSPEQVMEWYLEGTLHTHLGIGYDLMERWEVHKPEVFVKDLEWFSRLVHNSVFKRVQSPPIIVTSKTAFGYDLRESILPFEKSFRYERLEEQVKQMPEYIPKGVN